MFDGTYQTMAQVFIAVSIIPIWFMLRNGRGKSEPQSALWRMLLFGGLSIALTPVSYTHLDVYKRQSYTRQITSVTISLFTCQY